MMSPEQAPKGHSGKGLESEKTRRTRAKTACAECQRLKLKCDKQVPCSTCVRRRCTHLCPDKAMPTGYTLSAHKANDRLRAKVDELVQRIRQLEDALALLQSRVSDETHPLLAEEHRVDIDIPGELVRDPSEVVNALGSLRIKDREETFFGRSAGSEMLFLQARSQNFEAMPLEFPDHLSSLSCLFPFLPGGAWHEKDTIYAILKFLPDQKRASSLCETYFQQANWAQKIVDREELFEELMGPLYKHLARRNDDPLDPMPISPHQIAAIFLVFAHGSLMDLTLPPRSSEAEGYFLLGRAALSLQDMFERPELATVQGLTMCATYHHVVSSQSRNHYSIDSAWRVHSLSCKIAQGMGLHRDPGNWGFESKIVNRRRNLFWEIFSIDSFYSLGTGRPPCFPRIFVDCAFPEYEQTTLNKDGEIEYGFYHWKHSSALELQSQIIELTLQATPPTYDSVLKLDEKIRAFPIPSSLNMDTMALDPIFPPIHYLQKVLLLVVRGVSIIYLHRSFFVQAILDHPVNPLRSRYGPSFLAASRAASEVIKLLKRNYELYPDLCTRWGHFFIHVFSSAIIMGTIAIRLPTSSFAATARSLLDDAIGLFAKAPEEYSGGPKIKGILAKFQKRAAQVKNEVGPDKHLPACTNPCACAKANVQLSIFGGHTHVQRVDTDSARTSYPDKESPAAQQATMSAGKGASAPFPHEQTATATPNTLAMDSPFAADGGAIQVPIPIVPDMPELLFPSPDLQSVDTFSIGQMFSSDDYWTNMGSMPTSWDSSAGLDQQQQQFPDVYWPRSDASSAQVGYLDNMAAMDVQWMVFIHDTGVLQGGEVNDVGA